MVGEDQTLFFHDVGDDWLDYPNGAGEDLDVFVLIHEEELHDAVPDDLVCCEIIEGALVRKNIFNVHLRK